MSAPMGSADELRSRGLKYVALIMFLDALAASLGMSVLPYLVDEVGGTPAQYGTLLATFSSANIAASLWIGAASDRFGRRPLLIVSMFGLAIGFAASALATSMAGLFVARATIGFFAGIGSTGRAYIADICSDKEERTRAITQLGGLMMFGFAFGPPIGSALALLGIGSGMRTPFFVAAICSAIGTVVVTMRLPNANDVQKAELLEASAAAPTSSSPTKASTSAGESSNKGQGEAPGALFYASLALMLLAGFFGSAGEPAFMLLQPLFIKDVFGWGAPQFAVMMTCFVLGMAVTQIAIFAPVQKKVGILRLGSFSGGALGLACLGFTAVNGPSFIGLCLFGVSAAVAIFASALMGPIVNVLIAERAPSDQLGFAMGLASTAVQAGRVIFPIGLAFLYDKVSSDAAFAATGAIMWSAAICFLAVASCSPRAKKASPALSPARRRERPTLQDAIGKTLFGLAATRAFNSAGEMRALARKAHLEHYVLEAQLDGERAAAAVDSIVCLCPQSHDRMRNTKLFEDHAIAQAYAEEAAEVAEAAEAAEAYTGKEGSTPTYPKRQGSTAFDMI